MHTILICLIWLALIALSTAERKIRWHWLQNNTGSVLTQRLYWISIKPQNDLHSAAEDFYLNSESTTLVEQGEDISLLGSVYSEDLQEYDLHTPLEDDSSELKVCALWNPHTWITVLHQHLRNLELMESLISRSPDEFPSNLQIMSVVGCWNSTKTPHQVTNPFI